MAGYAPIEGKLKQNRGRYKKISGLAQLTWGPPASRRRPRRPALSMTLGEDMPSPSDPLIAKLIDRLHDADALARRNAAGALRLHGRRAVCAIQELTRLLADDDLAVQTEARRALDRLRQRVA